MEAPNLLAILARDSNITSPTDTPLPVPDDSVVIWQAALWPLIALALNAMLQRSASWPFPNPTPFAPTRSSPVVCLVDFLVFLLWLLCGHRVGAGFRASICIYRKEMGIYDEQDNVLLRGTPVAGLILSVLVPLPQATKLFGMKGVPLTQFLAAMFLLAYVVGVVECTLGVPREGDGVMTKKLDKNARHTLVQISQMIYYAAFLVQVCLWLVIAAVVFSPGWSKKVGGDASNTVQYKVLGILFIIGGVVFTARVTQSSFQAWYMDQAFGWVQLITELVCFPVGITISFAGVAVMLGTNLVYSWMGALISAPIPQPKKTESMESNGGSTPAAEDTTESHERAPSGDVECNYHDLNSVIIVGSEQNEERDPSERFTELLDLNHPTPKETQGCSASATQVSEQPELVVTKSGETEFGNRDESRSTSTELPDLALPMPAFLPLRRAISLPTNNADLARMQKCLSLMAGTGLLAKVSAPTAIRSEPHKAGSKPVAARKVSQTRTMHDKVMKEFWESGLVVGFAVTNLVFGIFYYWLLYSSEGTQKSLYAEVIG